MLTNKEKVNMNLRRFEPLQNGIQQEQIMFEQAMIKLGYKIDDIIPVDILKVQQQSKQYVAKMKPREKEFYVVRKAQALQQRRQKVLREIDFQVTKMKRYTVQRKNRSNPIVQKLLNDHQKIYKNKLKFIRKRQQIIQSRNSSNSRQSDRGSIDLGRTSPVFFQQSKSRGSSYSAKESRVSTNSANSQRLREKLKLKREKDAQIEKFKKQIMDRKNRESRKRVSKVQDDYLNKSRKIKARSQIYQQIVCEKKRQLDFADYIQKREKVQNLRDKIKRGFQAEVVKKTPLKTTSNFPFKKIRKEKQQVFKQNVKQVYDYKMQQAEQRKKLNDFGIRYTIDVNRNRYQQKQMNAKQHLKMRNQQQKLIKLELYGKSTEQIQRARAIRQKRQQQLKARILEERVKEQITRMNKQNLQERKKINTESKMRRKVQKLEELKEIDSFKKVLKKDRDQLQKYSKNRYRIFSNDRSFNLEGVTWKGPLNQYSNKKSISQHRYSFNQ